MVTLIYGDARDALFVGIIVANAGIGITQEVRAKRALDRLSLLVAPQATIRRGEATRKVPLEEVVVDDVVLLSPGDQLVADGRLQSASDLRLDESVLTGESEPPHRARGDEVRSSAFVVEGTGAYRVTAVGDERFAARITGEARSFRHRGGARSVAERVGRQLGIDRVYAEQSPDEKLHVVRTIHDQPELRPVIMVGDGVNDAPALALADLGIAMGSGGATVSSETADAVITVDRIDRVADALHVGRRALQIARQSVLAGMGLSIAAMCVAAAGYPIGRALPQEGIDLAVILNALRALRG